MRRAIQIKRVRRRHREHGAGPWWAYCNMKATDEEKEKKTKSKFASRFRYSWTAAVFFLLSETLGKGNWVPMTARISRGAWV